MPKYREIIPKQNSPSTEVVVEGGDGNQDVRRVLKKGGRRGSLKPEKRQKATEMRDVRACATCYINHIEVGSDSSSNYSTLIENMSVQKNLFVTNAAREMRGVHSNLHVV